MAEKLNIKEALSSGGTKVLLSVAALIVFAVGMTFYLFFSKADVERKISTKAVNETDTPAYRPVEKSKSTTYYSETLEKTEKARVEENVERGKVAVEKGLLDPFQDYGPRISALEKKTDAILEEQRRIIEQMRELAMRRNTKEDLKGNGVEIPYMKNEYGVFASNQYAQSRVDRANAILAELSPFPTASVVNVGIRLEQNTQGNAQSASGQSAKNGEKIDLQSLEIVPGDVLFGYLDTEINSDYPGPVVASVSDKRLPNGTKAFGGFKTIDQTDGMIVQFNRLVLPDGTSIPINAYAVDLGLRNYNVADSVSRHLLMKLGATFAAAWIRGIGTAKLAAITASGSGNRVATPVSRVTLPDGTTVYQYDQNATGNSVVRQTTDRDVVIAGLTAAGDELSQEIKKLASRPTTFRKYVGSSLGVLIID